jgi:uncharacterized membrane protein
MAALSYLLLPLTGTIVFFFGSDARARFHGLQAVIFGLVWPITLYAASALGETATRLTFGLGAILWLAVLSLTAAGRNPSLPGLRPLLRRWSLGSPRVKRGGS